MKFRRPSRFFSRAIIFVLALIELAYVIWGNYFLRGPLLTKVLNDDPYSLQVSYRSAVTIIPGLVHLKKFQIGGQSGDVKWRVDLESARVWVNLPALYRRRFRVLSVAAKGAAFTLALNQPKRVEPPNEEGSGESHPFKVDISGIDLDEFNLIRIDHYSYLGPGHIQGDFLLVPGQSLFIRRGVVSFLGGSAFLDDKRISSELRGQIDGQLKSWSLNSNRPTGEIFDQISAELGLRGQLSDANFLNNYIRSVEWLKILDVSGEFDLAATLRDGKLENQSNAKIVASKLVTRLANYEARGAGVTEWKVDKNLIAMTLNLVNFQGYRRGSERVLMHGKTFGLEVSSRELLIRKLFSNVSVYDLRLNLPTVSITDLKFLNAFIPVRRFEVIGGTGELAATLNVSHDVSGEPSVVKFSSNDLSARYEKTLLHGDVSFDTHMTDAGKGAHLFKVKEATIALNNLHVSNKEASEAKPPWSGSIGINQALLRPFDSTQVFTGKAQLIFDDARPILTVLATDSFIARVLSKIADIKNLHGDANFVMGPGLLEFSKVKVNSSDLNVEGDLRFIDEGQSIRALVGFGALELGLDVHNSTTKTKIIGARNWLRQQPEWPALQTR